ncbi:helix-turn-helix domain-containing protein [Garciella nitratireducens]|uniref:DNA binding domain-containing protein, excisionase family n=1 Tax=Garciella nitratireducens DSM 15102 TaxID=1121911 RepID=A0A1T4K5C8_9FIRM|nr:helix-turn-helix domain-containing protein [Garciella nitratireducens]SJZ37616.1 DNA binding domain-containing protein, excisionase family [Garciella nitratireducens DSM 15102]
MPYKFETKKELIDYISSEVLTTSEAVKLLSCSRQYINQLVKEKKLLPIKKAGNTTLFLKSDVLNIKS